MRSPSITADCEVTDCKCGEMVVRAEILDEAGQCKQVVCVEDPEDLPSTPAILVLVQPKSALPEFIAKNIRRRDVIGLRSTPIGSPTLEMCVQQISELLQQLVQRKFQVAQKSGKFKMVTNSWAHELPDDMDPLTHTVLLHGDEPHETLTIEEYARRMHRSTNTPIGFDSLVNVPFDPGEPEDGGQSAVMLGGPYMAHKLLELKPLTCLEALIFLGYDIHAIYKLVTAGCSFQLEVLQWEEWRVGDDPASKRHFPATREGVAAFLEKYFPEVHHNFSLLND